MARQMKADRLGLVAQPVQRLPFRDVGQAQRLRPAIAAKEADLAAVLFLRRRLGAAQDGFGAIVHARAACLDAVESAGAGQVLDLHLVDLPGIHPGREIGEILEAVIVARFDHGLHRGMADFLDGGERIADAQRLVLVALQDKIGFRSVDVGRQDANAHPRAFLAQGGELVGVVDGERHAGRDEGHGVVGLHPCGLPGDQGVGGGVRFVEAVVGELGHEVEHLVGLRRIDAVGDGAGDEDLALGLHLGSDLLAHGAAQEIGGAETVARHFLGDLHHLFLVDHDAVGFAQDIRDHRVRRLPGLAMLALAIGRDVGHRARTIQRDGGDQVLEAVRPHLAQDVAHALAFELEHPARVALLQHVEGLGVLEREFLQRDRNALLFQEAHRAWQDGEGRKPQEVELHQTGLLDIFHRVLRDPRVRLGVAIDRHQFGERPVADDDAGGMGRGLLGISSATLFTCP